MSSSRLPSAKLNAGRISQDPVDGDSTSQPRSRSTSRSPSRKKNNGANGLTEWDVNAQWSTAQKRNQQQLRSYPIIQTKNEGFFKRTRRQISLTLPTFHTFDLADKNRREKDKLERGRWSAAASHGRTEILRTYCGSVLRRFKPLFIVLGIVALLMTILSQANLRGRYRRNLRLGGGSKFVIILAANEGGGVMDWKGPREWAIERDSVRNKRSYADRWGYHLEIADVSTKKRYAHEWRESWERVDIIRNCMAKYPKAEWFWWLDLNTFIMEPSVSLQKHIFNNLAASVYRDINSYNPLNITHPPRSYLLDPISQSPTGDNLTSSIDLILAQDCAGFNLGSFFVRRSAWTDRLLDIWWDPVLYEQKHMAWEHKEQDALEHVYTAQPWVRSHTAFVEQRKINSFPPAACTEQSQKSNPGPKDDKTPKLDPRFHYNERDRDFLVNMAGCEWGRDCWAEMYQYRELSRRLNRNIVQKFGGWIGESWLKYRPWQQQSEVSGSMIERVQGKQ